MRTPTLFVLCACVLGTPACEQSPAPSPDTVLATRTEVERSDAAQVMVLGTFHFANPGLDVVQYEVADVLSDARQAEIQDVVDAVAAFEPTRVAVEVRAPSVPRLDSLYRAYREGWHELGRSEVQQLGFRLADRFDHPRLYGIDHPGDFPFAAVMAYADEHDPDFAAWVQRTTGAMGEASSRRQRESSLSEILRIDNEPDSIAAGHAQYLRIASVGSGDTYVGADLLSSWYERNIRIFVDLKAIADPGERILVIFGAGHAAILRELVESDPGMILVEPNDYLPAGD